MRSKALLIGCGNSRERKVRLEGQAVNFTDDADLTTIDMDPNCGADIVMDMSRVAWLMDHRALFAFEDQVFDEIGAYDSLEHWGRQGDWNGWFSEMAEYHRILKPGGLMGIIVPIGLDAFADPGHTRFFQGNHFCMLNQQWYADKLAAGLPMTDYRWFWRLNFDVLHLDASSGHHLVVMLRKA